MNARTLQRIFVGVVVVLLASSIASVGWSVVRNEVQDTKITYIIRSINKLEMSMNKALERIEKQCVK